MDMQGLTQQITTLSAQFSEFKFWLIGGMALLGVVAAVVVAAASSYVKTHVKDGIIEGAKNAQDSLQKSISLEKSVFELNRDIREAQSAISELRQSLSNESQSGSFHISELEKSLSLLEREIVLKGDAITELSGTLEHESKVRLEHATELAKELFLLTQKVQECSKSVSESSKTISDLASTALAAGPWYDLPLTANSPQNAYGRYAKFSNNLVILFLDTAADIGHFHAATLPAGLRPANELHIPTIGVSESGGAVEQQLPIGVTIYANGNILIHSSTPGIRCSFMTSFIANL